MEIIQVINQHIPIWSVLCGDFVLKKAVILISPRLINKPNFLDPLENTLRYSVLKSKRRWITDLIGENPSFGLVKLTFKELLNFNTCFSNINFHKFVQEYVRAYDANNNFLIEQNANSNQNIKKTRNDVKKEYKLMCKLEEEYQKVHWQNVLDPLIQNKKSLSVALNRSLIVKRNKYTIVDGTHRISA